MSALLPAWDFQKIFVEPWTTQAEIYFWVVLMGFLVTAACGLVGNFIVLRKMSMVGDAISHSVLPGLVAAFLIVRSRSTLAMFMGALGAGMLTTFLIEWVRRTSRIKEDAVIGIVFSTLFAIGVILVSLFSSDIHLDTDCVLYGEIAFVSFEPMVKIAGVAIAPTSIFYMGIITIGVSLVILLFYKELLVSSFDASLCVSLGLPTRLIHYGLMLLLSIVIVGSFRAVGAILVVAMLILPGATARLLCDRLPFMLALTLLYAALSSLMGLHLAIAFNSSVASAMVVSAAFLFVLAWGFSLLRQYLHRQADRQMEASLD